MADRYDVAILGGGLAGQTLAIQLKRTRPETSVLLLEKRKGPAPIAAFKVGESTLEIAGHYFAEICGMRDHLESDHLWKLGLRYFFPAGDNRDITRRVEWGPPAPRRDIPFKVKTYQIDRGIFENALADRCVAEGVDRRDDCAVQDVEFGDVHRITYTQDGNDVTASSRWVVDATGRASLIKKKLGLGKSVDHNINSAWLRLNGGLNIDDWSDDTDWQARMQQQKVRYLYTNHLMDEGYWVWLIPLGSGAISIGIVADPRFHPFERINTLDAALDWLDEHEPVVADAVRSRPDDVQDFLKIENYAYGVERVYSTDRWCLTGDAGAFTDPFYSPGSDFIGLGNGCITDLVTRDLNGESVDQRVEQLNSMFLQQFERQLDFYTSLYEIWGNPQVMCAKLCWDLLIYWGLTSPRFIHGLWHDPDFFAEISDQLDRAYELNTRVQAFFREWHQVDNREAEDLYISLLPFPAVAFRRLDLERPVDAAGMKALIAENIGRMEGMAVAMFFKAAARLPGADVNGDRAVNPYAIGLDPDRWEQDGLFGGSGLTREEAEARAEGIQSIWLDEIAAAGPPAFAAGPPGGAGPPAFAAGPPGTAGPPPGRPG